MLGAWGGIFLNALRTLKPLLKPPPSITSSSLGLALQEGVFANSPERV